MGYIVKEESNSFLPAMLKYSFLTRRHYPEQLLTVHKRKMKTKSSKIKKSTLNQLFLKKGGGGQEKRDGTTYDRHQAQALSLAALVIPYKQMEDGLERIQKEARARSWELALTFQDDHFSHICQA